jgi:hypothetical protein
MNRTLRTPLSAAIAAILAVTALIPCTPALAAGFVDDSSLTGSIFYWQRQRDRKEMDPQHGKYGQYDANLHHASANASLDFSSGYLANFIGLDLAAFGAWN